MYKARSVWFFVIALLSLPMLGGCRNEATYLSGEAQGTTWHITIADRADAPAVRAAVQRRLHEIDLALSNYQSDSELMRFNRAPPGQWIALGPDLYHVLKSSERISRLSDGAFDITVAPLIDLWGFGPQPVDPQHPPSQHHDHVPDDAAIAAARARVGFRFLEVDAGEPRARKQRDLSIDVNGIAQGYTVDVLADLLAGMGYKNFLVEVGGELRLAGLSPRHTPWRVAIAKPSDDAEEAQQGIAGSGIGITTAGDYHAYFERDGKRYSHTIDPATGRPIEHKLASVTVIAASAEYADGMDTVLEVLGPERGYELAERLGLAAFFIVRDGDRFQTRSTRAFESYAAP